MNGAQGSEGFGYEFFFYGLCTPVRCGVYIWSLADWMRESRVRSVSTTTRSLGYEKPGLREHYHEILYNLEYPRQP